LIIRRGIMLVRGVSGPTRRVVHGSERASSSLNTAACEIKRLANKHNMTGTGRIRRLIDIDPE